MERFILAGVPQVHFYQGGPRCPEDIPFPACMRACTEFLGDQFGCAHGDTPGCAYAYFLAVSGAGFFLSWMPGWQLDNVALHYMSDDPSAPYRRAFAAAGYGLEIVQRSRVDEATYRSTIIDSLQRRRPVLGFGVIGPPEPSIITGYDDGGNVLMGWSFFQGFPEFNAGVEFEPTGEFRKRDWYADTEALMVFGARTERPPLSVLLRETLAWGLQVARTPVTYGNRPNGLAAYDAWAAQLLRDDEIPADDLSTLMERFSAHDDAVGTVAECRYYTGQFLQQYADVVPEMAADLRAAAECYQAEHDLMWQVWGQVGGNGRDEAKACAFAEPAVRRQIVPIIRQAREKDAEAAEHLAAALAR